MGSKVVYHRQDIPIFPGSDGKSRSFRLANPRCFSLIAALNRSYWEQSVQPLILRKEPEIDNVLLIRQDTLHYFLRVQTGDSFRLPKDLFRSTL